MVQAHTQPKSTWSIWFDQEIMDNLERSMSEIPETAQVLQELALWAGAWSWSQYSITQLGQSYRMIQLAAELYAEKNGDDPDDAMRVVVDALAGFESDSIGMASTSSFVRCVIDVCGTFDRKEIAALRARGFGDQEISEIAGAVALTLFVSLITSTHEDEHPRLRRLSNAG